MSYESRSRGNARSFANEVSDEPGPLLKTRARSGEAQVIGVQDQTLVGFITLAGIIDRVSPRVVRSELQSVWANAPRFGLQLQAVIAGMSQTFYRSEGAVGIQETFV